MIHPDQSELEKTLLDLLSDSQLRANVGQNGRRLAVENFSWELAARRREDIYRMAMQCDRHQPGQQLLSLYGGINFRYLSTAGITWPIFKVPRYRVDLT